VKKGVHVLFDFLRFFSYHLVMLETFGRLIEQYFREKGSIPDFVRENYPSNEEAARIRTIRRYVSDEMVPRFSAAKELVDKLNIKISDEELLSILEFSASEKSVRVNYKHSYLFEKISLRTSDLYKDSGMMDHEIQNMFTERINDVSGGNIKEYLVNLIEYDLENFIRFKKIGNVPKNESEGEKDK